MVSKKKEEPKIEEVKKEVINQEKIALTVVINKVSLYLAVDSLIAMTKMGKVIMVRLDEIN